jgi:hypothetical protein
MTTTVTVPFVTSLSTEDVTLPAANKADLVLASTNVDAKSGRITAAYTIAGADSGYPSQLIVTDDPPGPDVKNRYGSFTFKTWVKRTTSLNDGVEYWPLQATISFVVAGDAPLALSDFGLLLAAAFSYTYASVTTKVRDTAWLSKVLAGSPVVK